MNKHNRMEFPRIQAYEGGDSIGTLCPGSSLSPGHQWLVSKLKQAEACCDVPQDASASFCFQTGD